MINNSNHNDYFPFGGYGTQSQYISDFNLPVDNNN
ncbi:unnamed protein product [Trichobilharzia regenti]|nr:unnamed protein product [Trichobilharzia regenti]